MRELIGLQPIDVTPYEESASEHRYIPWWDGSLGELSIPPGCGEFWIVPVQRVATTERDSFLVCRGIGLPLPQKAVEAVHRRLHDGLHLFISFFLSRFNRLLIAQDLKGFLGLLLIFFDLAD